ncbi:hypothetical protein ISCGN_014487 [Ixodes scapularis]|uniref:Uncharacterized protein n=1 Tax=Ixodes scapularis TaxID=6945 RepID=B7Q5T9_IXOSC|nr:hypothetical protein IscW_ISCW011175 [Ixodes scapularis]|eukprot:XP_002411812.1 hypothetical protein IscW_ISCW011175 [Ixodes scapularis]
MALKAEEALWVGLLIKMRPVPQSPRPCASVGIAVGIQPVPTDVVRACRVRVPGACAAGGKAKEGTGGCGLLGAGPRSDAGCVDVFYLGDGAP